MIDETNYYKEVYALLEELETVRPIIDDSHVRQLKKTLPL